MMHTYLCPYATYTLVPTLLQGPCSFRSQQSEQLQPAQIEAGPSECPYDCTTARLYCCTIVMLYDCTAVRLSRDNRSWWRLQSRNKRIRNWQLRVHFWLHATQTPADSALSRQSSMPKSHMGLSRKHGSGTSYYQARSGVGWYVEMTEAVVTVHAKRAVQNSHDNRIP